MCRILAIANMKGGVGKTTATAILAAALVQHGRKVLAVDLDPQAFLTVALGFKPDELPRTIANALDERAVPLTTILQWTPEGFDLVPANYQVNKVIQNSKRTSSASGLCARFSNLSAIVTISFSSTARRMRAFSLAPPWPQRMRSSFQPLWITSRSEL